MSTGKALEAMILNGLGFVNKRLYLIPRFFSDKPVESLLGPGISAAQLNDDRLGRALDTLYQTGLPPLFSHLSERTLSTLGYRPDQGQLDSTSLRLWGQYNSEKTEPTTLHITQGYSKDHRPDLPQVVLQLISEHLSGIPLHMEVLDGNSSDSESFRQTLERFGESLYHQRGLRTIIADSKLYSQQTLQVLEESGLNWISRVPGALEDVKQLLDQIQPTDLTDWDWEGEGYQSACYTNEYGEVKQHWVVYHSAKAAEREEKTLRRKVEKEAEKAGKSLRKLQRQVFHCQADAQAAAAQWEQQWKWHRLVKVALKEQRQYAQPGRPAKDSAAQRSYQIEAQLKFRQAQWQAALFRRSLFVLATNQELNLAEEQQALLEAYKAQHSVERGFRFIKDPQIVASAFFVKKPERVAALLFVMTTCLLVYSALEYRIRKRLTETETSVPDQKGKPTQSPTARWVFQLFVGIHQLILPDQNKIILNLKEEHHTITQLLGYAHFYS